MKKRYNSAGQLLIGYLIVYIIYYEYKGFDPLLLNISIAIWLTVAITIFIISVNERPDYVEWKNIPYHIPFKLLECVTIKNSTRNADSTLSKGEYWYHIKIGLIHCTLKVHYKLDFEYNTTLEKLPGGGIRKVSVKHQEL